MKRSVMTLQVYLLAMFVATSVMAHGKKKDSVESESVEFGEQLDFGRVGKSAETVREVVVEMTDRFRFKPSKLTVKRGETVRLVFRNGGALLHEWIIGMPEEIKKHAALMRRFPNMEHDDPHNVHVPPGEQRELVWQFNRSGTFEFACLLPGHFEAGMKGIVEVQ